MSTAVIPLKPVTLTRQERRALEGLALGLGVDEVAYSLSITAGTVSEYLGNARSKLRSGRENHAAIAMGYATDAITTPVLRQRDEVYVSGERQALIPLIAQGQTQLYMASFLGRNVQEVRADGRGLLVDLAARNPCHLVRRAWEFQLLTRADVARWTRQAEELSPGELRERIDEVRKWEARRLPRPSADDATRVTRELAAGGMGLVRTLAGQAATMPATSTLAGEVRDIIADAKRRLHLPGTFATQDTAVEWAIKTARMVSTLLYADAKVRRQQGV
ncbi:LuxR C-terminal-related transcriptional regulator [Streptomyces sp. NPDC091278]|uniref:LuxR C-terminal-related transcriptional regulator n=1 Tax=Streptomyces sp. NPDC091278 TaxID=3155301 RepID=UPI003450A9BC